MSEQENRKTLPEFSTDSARGMGQTEARRKEHRTREEFIQFIQIFEKGTAENFP